MKKLLVNILMCASAVGTALFLASTPQVAMLLPMPTTAHAAFCNSQENITGIPNEYPIIRNKPTFLRSTANGKLYRVGDPFDKATGGAYTYILHVYGADPYQWGAAHGALLRDEVTSVLTTAWGYFKGQVEAAINGTVNQYDIPQSVIEWLAEVGLEAALDQQYQMSLADMDPGYFEEMRGLAEASGVSYDMIRRIHYIGEITKGRCSFYGAWGKATEGAKTLKLRSLDWDTGAGLQRYPVLTVYHPQQKPLVHHRGGARLHANNGNAAEDGATSSHPSPPPDGGAAGHAFVNVAWAGWLGVLTGVSSKRLTVGEIGVSYPDYPPAFGDESTDGGMPFVYVLRHILQHEDSLASAQSFIEQTNRTCRLLMCVADGVANTARAVQYSHSIVRFFDDTDLEPLAPWHQRLENVVYEGMDWKCPFYQNALYRQLSYYHGSLTPELTIRNVTSTVMTGNLHAAVFDLTAMQLYVANHAPDFGKPSEGILPPTPEEQMGYSRPWIHVDLEELFATV